MAAWRGGPRDGFVRVLDAMGEEERRAAEQILVRLVSADRTRASVPRTSLLDPAAASTATARALDRLVEAKLANESAGQIDLAHETLITQWPLLRGLLASSGDDRAFRERVAAAARQWDAQRRPDGALWTGDQAQRLERWFEATGASLDQSELAFVEAVLRRARRALWLRRTATGAVVLVALTTGLVAVASERAMRKRLDATNARLSESRAAYAHAEASRLEALARSEVEYDPSAALRHAATSYDLEHAPGLDVIAWAARSRGVGAVFLLLGGAGSLARFRWSTRGFAAATKDARRPRHARLATASSSAPGAPRQGSARSRPGSTDALRTAPDRGFAIADALSSGLKGRARPADARAIERTAKQVDLPWSRCARAHAADRDRRDDGRRAARPGGDRRDRARGVRRRWCRARPPDGSAAPRRSRRGARLRGRRERTRSPWPGAGGRPGRGRFADGDLLGRIPTARAITSVGAPGRGDRLVAGIEGLHRLRPRSGRPRAHRSRAGRRPRRAGGRRVLMERCSSPTTDR